MIRRSSSSAQIEQIAKQRMKTNVVRHHTILSLNSYGADNITPSLQLVDITATLPAISIVHLTPAIYISIARMFSRIATQTVKRLGSVRPAAGLQQAHTSFAAFSTEVVPGIGAGKTSTGIVRIFDY